MDAKYSDLGAARKWLRWWTLISVSTCHSQLRDLPDSGLTTRLAAAQTLLLFGRSIWHDLSIFGRGKVEACMSWLRQRNGLLNPMCCTGKPVPAGGIVLFVSTIARLLCFAHGGRVPAAVHSLGISMLMHPFWHRQRLWKT